MQTTPKQIETTAIASSASWRGVDPADILAKWQEIAPLIRRALMAGDTAFDERTIGQALLSGTWQVWTYGENPIKSLCITEVITFPRMTKMWVRYVVGEWDPFGKGLAALEAYARAHGCRRIEAHMRRGLTRRLPPDWAAERVIMVKEL